MSFLTRFLQNLLSCSCCTENLVKNSREADFTAPPTSIDYLGYEVDSQSPPKKSSLECGFPATFSKPLYPSMLLLPQTREAVRGGGGAGNGCVPHSGSLEKNLKIL